MKIRLFGVENCKRCCLMKQLMHRAETPWVYVDANADDTQELCDKYGIDDLPHIQILSDNGDVLMEHIGYLDPYRLKRVVSGFTEAED